MQTTARPTCTDRLIDACWGLDVPAPPVFIQSLDYRDAFSEDFTLTACGLVQGSLEDVQTLQGRVLGLGVAQPGIGRRWFCGIVDGIRCTAQHGAWQNVSLQVVSALALLDRRTACRVFQDMSVPDIVACILEEHRQGNAGIALAFDHRRCLLAQHDVRSYCVQFNESDKTFIERLLAEEGISYRFTFDLLDGTPRHLLVLSDQPLFDAERAIALPLRAAGADDGTPHLQAWQLLHRLPPSRHTLSSFDYASAQQLRGSDDLALPASADVARSVQGLESHHARTLYYGSNSTDMNRYARMHMQAQELRARTWLGEGDFRGLATADSIQVDGHPGTAEASPPAGFLISGVHLLATNNLPDAVPSLGPATEHVPPAGQCITRFRAVPGNVPLLPVNAHQLLRPNAPGMQTATVVGPPGETVYTDPLGRIRIRFHWQRAQDHPAAPDPQDERSSTWVRVAMPSAGDGFGHQFLPRVGQEVVVAFLHGDIDRPLVIGGVYNGRHATPRFGGMGSLPGNRAVSGIRSNEHGGKGFSELSMDDTGQSVGTTLRSSPFESALHLGHVATPRRDGSAQPRGQGAELRTDAALALRSAKGLLVSSHAQLGAGGAQMALPELLEVLGTCRQLFGSLAEMATRLQAGTPEADAQRDLETALRGWSGDTSAANEPVIALAAAAGLVSASPASQLHVSGQHHEVVAQGRVQHASGERMQLLAGKGLSMFVAEGGLQAVANQGDLQLQARDGLVDGHALSGLQLSSEQGEIVLSAPSIRLVAADGSFIRIGDGVTVGSNGALTFHGADHRWEGPASDHWSRTLPTEPPPVCLPCLLRAAASGGARVQLAGAA
ncbi:type VI secretion system tip protein TssI/VgrG [Stenotrophomonas maltophilia]|uniref:type VI secretion system Vgr family protein n=1 Tax=Stenotrophomonas maltophilia TaxID=40324 RepID=UPI00309D474A